MFSIPLIRLSDNQNYTEAEIASIHELKKEYVEFIEKQAENIDFTEASLVCALCEQSICTVNQIKQVASNPPQFIINHSYGSLIQTTNIIENEFSDFISSNYLVTS